MEPLYIDFSDSVSLSAKTRFVGGLMFIIGLIGTILCIIEGSFGFSFFLTLTYTIWGVFMFTPLLNRLTSRNKPFIKIDNSTIDYRTTPFSFPKKEEWTNITDVTIKSHSIFLETKSGQKKKINLNWISRRNELIIKQSIREIANEKGINVFLINQ